MLIIIKLLLIFIFVNIKSIFASEECKTNSNIRIGLIEDAYIDYQYYLYYELGNFAQTKNIEFDFEFVENNADDFDIIFGEWDKISNLSLNEISLPSKVKKFYEDNGININTNILPLDLDTYIVLSNQKYSLKNLEELSNFYSPTKYTLGMNFSINKDLLRLISFLSRQDLQEVKPLTVESTLSSLNRLYKNSNKNILNADFIEIYNSYVSKENLFTLFSDGILLYKNLPDSSFNLFPQSKYIWNEELGIFKNDKNHIPYSFFGFSAYVNNTNQIGLICHFLKEEVRTHTFKNFNIQISPLSINELNNFENLPYEYSEIIKVKNQNIITINEKLSDEIYNEMRNIIFEKSSYQNFEESNNYLN